MKNLALTICLVLMFGTMAQAQYSEDFKYVKNGWYVKNNSYPPPVAPNNWSNRGDSKFLGSQPGDDLNGFLTDFSGGLSKLFGFDYEVLDYPYMSVEYSQYDHDDAQISNWLISPVIQNLKNGDIIEFDTKQWSKSDFDNFTSYIHFDTDGIMACERPNRLEVRLSTNGDATPNVGNSPNSVGDFTVLLGVVNDGLSVGGYPRNWQKIQYRISGLPPGTSLSGRIGFWYRFDHGGYKGSDGGNCRGRRDYSLDQEYALQLAKDLGTSALESALGKYDAAAAPVINGISTAFEIWDASQVIQNGTNGTAIAIDNVKHLPIQSLLGPYVQNQVRRAWNVYTSPLDPVVLEYNGGSHEISSSRYYWRETFNIKNTSNQFLRIEPKFKGYDWAKIYKIKSYNTSQIQPGETYIFDVYLRDSVQYEIENSKITLHLYDDVGRDIVQPIKFVANIDPRPQPIAKTHNEDVILYLGPDGTVGISDAKAQLDGGSVNSLGGTEGLSYSAYGFFDCSDVGTQEVWLRVSESSPSGNPDYVGYSYAKKEVKVRQPVPSIDQLNDQAYYLKEDEKSMLLDSIFRPHVNTVCADSARLDVKLKSENRYVYPELGLGVGSYELTWSFTYHASPTSLGSTILMKSNLQVLDTIPPTLDCSGGVNLGFIQYAGEFDYIRFNISGEDLGKASDNVGIWKYEFSTPGHNSGAFASSIPISCDDVGRVFPVTVRVYDFSGNTFECTRTVTMARPDIPETRDISIDLDSELGFATITPEQVLVNGADGVCGVTNSAVSRAYFNCDDVNQTVPVTVSYTSAGVEYSATAHVTVNEYSEPSACADTVKLYVGASYQEAFYSMYPLINSVCSARLPWSIKSEGATKFTESGITGEVVSRDFKPGISRITRSTILHGETIQCPQIILVQDTLAPVILSTPTNQDFDLPRLDACVKPIDVVNPFQQGSYAVWSYELSGATTKTKTYRMAEYLYYQDRVEDFNIGVTNVKIWAEDLVGNRSEVNYTVDISVGSYSVPYVSSAALEVGSIQGDFDTETYQLFIDSPVQVQACDPDDYMWYYEVRDGYLGNIIDERDSIPQDSGAEIPLKVGPALNYTYNRTVHLGYHDPIDGARKLKSYETIYVRDTATTFDCPADETFDNNNSTTYSYNYDLSPASQLGVGSYWGYSVTGATQVQTTDGGTVIYSSNQSLALGDVTIPDAYPVLAADSVASVTLNNGINTIKLRYLEASGNMAECSYQVVVNDISLPDMTCPPADTLYRSSSDDCFMTIGEACTQVSGFTGPFGTSRIRLLGGNEKVVLRQENAPTSIQFSTTNQGISYSDAFIEIPANCNGTISFTWTYQNPQPQFFRPFVTYYDADQRKYNTITLSGYSQAVTGQQTGTISQSVDLGDRLLIGVQEGGANAGYFTISDFSAPHSVVTNAIAQPQFTAHPSLFFESNLRTQYDLGEHQVKYTLINVNNGERVECVQDLVVIDEFATALACVDTTVYLNDAGTAIIGPSHLVNSCFAVTSTTLSQNAFNGSHIGSNVVTVTSVNSAGDTLTCTSNVTVVDQIAPRLVTQRINIDLPASNTVTLSDSLLLTFFEDNHKIQSVTTSQTTFSCDDVGARVLSFTATDSSGNVTNASVVADIAPLGFARNDPKMTIYDVCEGETIEISSSSYDPSNYVEWVWQVKDYGDSTIRWGYYSCTATEDMVKGLNPKLYYHRINNVRKDVYMVYESNNTLQFAYLDPSSETWEPALAPIPRASLAPSGITAYYMDAFQHKLYVVLIDGDGIIKSYQWGGQTGQWSVVDDHMFISYSVPENGKYFEKLFSNEGYFFAVHESGRINMGIELSSDFGERIIVHQGTYDTRYSVHISNAGDLFMIRDQGVNYMYQHVVNVTETRTDPTGNSSLFTMATFKGEKHIAYKDADGKLSLKKYAGSDTWTVVSQGVSNGTISKLEMITIGNKLYITFVDGSEVRMMSWDGTSWDDLGVLPYGLTDFEMYSILDEPGVLFGGSNPRLIKNTGWQNLSFTGLKYTPDTSVPSDKLYRNITSKYDCDFTVSGISRVTVHEYPVLTMYDNALNGAGGVTLQAETTLGEIKWLSSLDSGVIASGPEFTRDFLVENDTFLAVANNAVCYSDTLSAVVFVNDIDFPDYHVTYPDTVCAGDFAQIEIDTAVQGLLHSFLKKGEDGQYSMVPGYSPTSSTYFYLYPNMTTETGTYRFLVEEEALDAAQITYGGSPDQEHLDFGTLQLDYSDEVTIEAWVNAVNQPSSPSNVLGLLYHNANYWDPDSSKNFEWTQGMFRVMNGATVRELAFPSLAGHFSTSFTNWFHVTATASPDSLRIYYNGNLVAELAASATGNINNEEGNLSFAIHRNRERLTGCSGVDEFKIWNHARSADQIAASYNSCGTGFEEGLLLYNNFENVNADTKTFSSVIGSDAILVNQPTSTKPQMKRDVSCSNDIISKKLLEPFTIHVLDGQPYIITMDEYWPSSGEGEGPGPQLTCGGDTVTLNATVSSGEVSWYTSEVGGELVGTGSPFSIFMDRDTILFAGVGENCSRRPVFIDIAGFPKILSASADTMCITDNYRYRDIDFNIELNDESYDYYIYENPTGGTPSDWDDDIRNRDFTGTDTLYISAYNDYCESDVRVPVLIYGVYPQVSSLVSDTTLCGPGSVTLSGDFEAPNVMWYYGTWTESETYTTPELSIGTHQVIVDSYQYYNNGDDYCYSDRKFVNITVDEAPSRYDTIIACDSYTWIDGETYTSSNSAILFNKESSVTCDSAIYLNLTIIDVEESDVSVSTTNTCPGETITFTLGNTELGVDYSLLNNEDSVFAGPTSGTGGELSFTTGELQTTEVFRVLANKSATVGSQSNTCDVQVGNAVTVNIGQTTSSRTVARCGDYLWNGTTYFETGVYYDTLTSSLGCDSVARLNLTIFPKPTHTHVVEACDSYTWKGVTYTESTNTPTWTGKTVYGCDSLVTLDLTIKESVSYETSVTACDSYEWNEMSYTASGSYIQTLTSGIGCDSTVTVHLTINQSTRSDTTAIVCESFDWYGTTYTSSGAYDRVITNNVGCDSTITLNLTVNEATYGDTTAVACSSFSWYGNDYTSSGDYERLLTNVAGCDSTVTLHLTINQPTTSDTTAVSCGPFDWYSNNYTASGDYSRVIQNAAGCDSTITLHLTVNPASDPEYSSLDVETCHSYTFNGTELTASGSYEVTLKNTMGCDSVVTLNLTLLEGKCWKDGAWVNGAPDTSDDVVIADTYTVTDELRVRDLQITNGGTLSVPSNGILEIAGDISNGGSITLESGADFLSYAGNAVTGNDITFERNMRHETAAYSMMGSPVQQSADVKGSIAGITWAYDENKPYEAGTNEGLKRWLNWKNSELVPGHGYASANIEQLIFEGDPNVGTITVSNLSYTPEANDSTYAGWHLLSNPYGASIDVGDFLTENQNVIEGFINLWDDPNTGERGSNSDYMTMNAVGEVSSNPRGDRFNGHVLTGQGFFVRRLAETSGSSDVVFTESMRYTGYNQDGAYFRQINTEKDIPKLWISMTDLDGRYGETLIGLPDDATTGLDHFYDAPKVVTVYGHQLYSIVDKKPYAIQGLPPLDELAIPLGYSRDVTGYVSFKLKESEQISKYYDITLKDNLKKVEYSFENESIDLLMEDKTNNNRFALILRKKNVLSASDLDNRIEIIRESSSIKVSTSKQMTTVKLVDLMGRVKQMKLTTPNNCSFEEPTVKGVYIVYIQFNDGMIHTNKLIID